MKKNPLPNNITRKIFKTGQTRGADDDEIYQNRVGRNSTVLIPFQDFEICQKAPTNSGVFEHGYIVLIKPEDYFNDTLKRRIESYKLVLGENLLVFYETRKQWKIYPPLQGWSIPNSRMSPLGGQYVARVPATTSIGESKINCGYDATSLKGAGIRVYEYADSNTIKQCRLQVEYLFWQCIDTDAFINQSSSSRELKERKASIESSAKEQGLADKQRLIKARILNHDGHTICPLCLQPISALGFGDKMQQAEGRDVPDLTVTEVSLFHIRELRTGEYNHSTYNLGWGHHHCNVVVKDSGIQETLKWMRKVLRDNEKYDLENL